MKIIKKIKKISLNYYKNIITFFKKEPWSDIVISFISNAIISSLMCVNINTYCKFVIETYSLDDIPDQFKLFRDKHFNILINILNFNEHDDLWKIVKNNDYVYHKWKEFFQDNLSKEIIILLKNEDFFRLNIAFSKNEYEYDEIILY